MDTTGFSQVGRHGTLSLLKRRPSAPTAAGNDLITSFGIDDPTLTFGSTSTCGVRLYYSDVEPLHCKLIFEDGKAFLVVLGQSGVFVDGCWVYPHSSSGGGSSSAQEQEQQQTIIPLSNNSEFEIHQKRFRFTYPPKEIRKVLLATPAPVKKRALRLSMIQSAQVFSPRPSKDPRENLRILQTPLKQGIFPPNSPAGVKTPTRTRAVSPLKYSTKMADSSDSESDDEATEAEEEDIVLVETNHPRVVEEEQDLIILEDVPLDGPPVPQVQAASSEVAAPQPQPPRTPRRKSLGGTALHRAVLIRSAQRAVWRAEREKEEEAEREEEMEVLGAVVDPVEDDDGEDDYEEEDGDEYEDNDVEMRSVSSEEDGAEEEDNPVVPKEENKSLWRKSLTKIIPWGFGTSTQDDDQEEADDDNHDDSGDQDDQEGQEEEEEEEDNEEPTPLPTRPAQTPIKRVLGSFMTPQLHNPARTQKDLFPAVKSSQPPMAPPGLPGPSNGAAPNPGPGRYSLGGGEPQRIIVQQPWRIKDLVVPTPSEFTSSAMASGSSVAPRAIPARDSVPPAPRATPVVTAEERRAIQERRRSAVREVREDAFWKDGAPGMSPTKTRMSLGGAPQMSSPIKGGADAPGSSTALAHRLTSPTKGRSLGYAIAEEGDSSMATSDDHPAEEETEEDALDTRSLLDRMRETVEDMKRRRSIASTPRPESLADRPAPTPGGVPTSVALASPTRAPGGTLALGSVKKLDFSRISSPAVRTPLKPSLFGPVIVSEEDTEAGSEPEGVTDDAPFSLLRANSGTSSTLASKALSGGTPQVDEHKRHHDVQAKEVVPISLPDVVVDDVQELSEEALEDEAGPHIEDIKGKGTARGRPRMLRSTKAVDAPKHTEDAVDEPSQLQVATKTTRSRSAKSPAPPPDSENPTPALAPPVTRRQRSKTPQVDQTEEIPEPPPTRSRRTRKGTVEAEEPTPAPVRRGKKAIAEPEGDEEPEKKTRTPAAKRGRKPRAAPAEEENQQEEGEAPADVPELEPSVPAAAPAKRSRSRKAAAREPEPESREDADQESSDLQPSSLNKQSSIPVKAAPKGRKKTVVKEEPAKKEEEEESLPLATTRAGRSAKTPAATKVAAPSTVPTKIVKPRGKLRTPATTVATRSSGSSSTSTANAEKENTHEAAGSGSGVSDEADDAPVKVRVSRKTGAAASTVLDSGKAGKSAIPRSAPRTTSRLPAKSKVKEEDEDSKDDVPRGRTTRATRTRTKTG